MRFKAIKGIVLILATMLLCTACGKGTVSENTERVNLSSEWGITEKGDFAIVSDGEYAGVGKTIAGEKYILQENVADFINSKFFMDEENNQVIFTTPTEILYFKPEESQGVVRVLDGKIYIKYDYVLSNSNIESKWISKPDRICINTVFGEIKKSKATKDTVIRVESSIKSKILADLKKGDSFTVLEEGKNYSLIISESGIKGYIKNETMSDVKTEEKKSTYKGAEYKNISLGKKVCLGWHQLEALTGNSQIIQKIKDSNAINVISPTWYKVSDETGTISSLASKEYVETAHKKGIQVWALINDFLYDDTGRYFISDVLNKTTSRENLINNLMMEVDENKIDGINIDFENIKLEDSKNYIQFIRELSVSCRNKGIVLSVDMYVPMSFNEYYGREEVGEVVDYLIIMGYDEHWAGGDSAGSVASLSYVKSGIEKTLKVVDANKVINAIPFYTRLWSETPEALAKEGSKIINDPINGNYSLSSVALGMDTAMKTLTSRNIEPYWNEEVSQYYGEYEEGGITYRIWLEEEKSIETKLHLMEESNLAGVACWKLGLEKQEIWGVIKSYLDK
jgi:spore germination protein YaaH